MDMYWLWILFFASKVAAVRISINEIDSFYQHFSSYFVNSENFAYED